ncbi:MAG: hypothetical protein E7B37_38975, partial [Bradyrhizobium sp.]|nr:hypothetical protein [Bradyrhizobium sp.]
MPKSASDSSSLAPSRKFDRDMSMPPETQVVIDFDDNRAASALVGPYGQNLAKNCACQAQDTMLLTARA